MPASALEGNEITFNQVHASHVLQMMPEASFQEAALYPVSEVAKLLHVAAMVCSLDAFCSLLVRSSAAVVKPCSAWSSPPLSARKKLM